MFAHREPRRERFHNGPLGSSDCHGWQEMDEILRMSKIAAGFGMQPRHCSAASCRTAPGVVSGWTAPRRKAASPWRYGGGMEKPLGVHRPGPSRSNKIEAGDLEKISASRSGISPHTSSTGMPRPPRRVTCDRPHSGCRGHHRTRKRAADRPSRRQNRHLHGPLSRSHFSAVHQ